MRRRNMLLAGAGAAFARRGAAQQAAALRALQPADFPDRPIELVVAFPAGGGMDVTARIVARQAELLTGHRFIVNNRTGGAGVVAHSYLARQAPADGYTVGIVSSGLFADSMLRSQNLWSHADLEIVGFLNYDATNWIVSGRGPLAGQGLSQVISRARERPDSVRISILPQSSSEFIVEQVEKRTNTSFLKVPFQGGVPGMTAMVGGHVDIATVFFSEYRSQLETGAVQPIAVAGAQRMPNLPQVPTFNETLGVTDMLWAAWRFAVVPKATPADRQRYLSAVLQAVVADPRTRGDFGQAGVLLDPALADLGAARLAAEKLTAAQRNFFRESGRLR